MMSDREAFEKWMDIPEYCYFRNGSYCSSSSSNNDHLDIESKTVRTIRHTFNGFKAGRASMQAELEDVKQDLDALAAHVNELLEAIDNSSKVFSKLANVPGATNEFIEAMKYSANLYEGIYNRTPQQSFEAHDREVRNQKAQEDIESISDEATVSLNILEQLKKDTPDMVNDINRVIHIHAGLVKAMSVIEATIEKELT